MSKAATNEKRHPFDSLDAGTKWVDSLLNLFWAVDELMKQSDDLPAPIQEAWEQAENARQKL